ncbi:MAG: hypothetical protein K2X38_03440 [Gemmataceae bacterium]|nr:hypothetical protein [Gemmataceae bacterium]
MSSWQQYARMSNEELERQNLAAVNLACAEALPGINSSAISRSLDAIERTSEKVRWLTLRQFRAFDRRPEDYHGSREYFRTLCLITVLQRDCGIRYNLSVIDETVPFTPAESFIHGALIGEGGSCATMPVVYAAVGRSLGYPIKLVSAKGERFTHLFARWDEEKKWVQLIPQHGFQTASVKVKG